MQDQHDAMVVTWKDKRDIFGPVRAVYAIRALVLWRGLRAYVARPRNVSEMLAREWEPRVPIQPRSEYSSASVVLCNASF